jgi:YVTN family beta-propeller protein
MPTVHQKYVRKVGCSDGHNRIADTARSFQERELCRRSNQNQPLFSFKLIGSLYVANRGSGTVSVSDTATNTVSATINGFTDLVAFGIFIR